jgi:plastocyanin
MKDGNEGGTAMRTKMTGVLLLVVAVFAFAACGGSGDGDGSSNAGGGGTTAEEPTGSTSGTTIELVAPSGGANTGYELTDISAPADTPFTIHFVNQDAGIPHDVQIYEGTDASGTPVFSAGDDGMITGPDETTYEVPALPAGTYTFTCMMHPTTMVGTLTVA